MINLIAIKFKVYRQMLYPFIIMTLLPLLFIYIFSSGFSKAYVPTIFIADEDQSDMSQLIIDRLNRNTQYSFQLGDRAEILEKLERGSGIGALIFEDGFEEQLDNVVFYKRGAAVEHMSLENQINSTINEVVSDKGFVDNLTTVLERTNTNQDASVVYDTLISTKESYPSYTVKFEIKNLSQNSTDTIKHYFTGFMLFFSMFIITFGMGAIVEDKATRVWNRQRVSPLSNIKLLLANIIVNYTIAMTQLFVVLMLSKLLFDIEWGGSMIALFAVFSAFVLAGTAIGLFIVGYVKTDQQLSAILPTIVVSTSMLGGCMWPIELVQNNKALMFIANLTPQRWGMLGLKNIIIYNGGLSDVVSPIIFLLVIAFAFSLASIIPYKNQI